MVSPPTPPLDGDACTVCIIGAGPVGLTMALALATYGVKSIRILERRSGPCEWHRAIGLSIATQEFLHRLGLMDEVNLFSIPADKVSAMYNAKIPLIELSPVSQEAKFPTQIICPTDVLCKIIVKALLDKHGISVEYNHGLDEICYVKDQSSSPLKLTVELLTHDIKCSPDASPPPEQRDAAEENERIEVRCAYVVGCDGVRSAVRRLLNLTTTSLPLPTHSSALIDCKLHWDLPKDRLYFFNNKEGAAFIAPLPGNNFRLAIASRSPNFLKLYKSDGHEPTEVDLSVMEGMLRRISGACAILEDPVYLSRVLTYTARICDSFASMRDPEEDVPRAFLVGDACQNFPPFGGQGLNLGLREVQNLSWKLAGVIGGRYQNRVLDTYESEMRPFAADLTHRMVGVTRGLLKPPAGYFTLAKLPGFPALLRYLAKFGGDGFFRQLWGLEVQFPVTGSCVAVGDFNKHDFKRSARTTAPGRRALNAGLEWQDAKVTGCLHDLLVAAPWTLLIMSGDIESMDKLLPDEISNIALTAVKLANEGELNEPRIKSPRQDIMQSLIVVKGIDRSWYFPPELWPYPVGIDAFGKIHDAYGVTVPSFILVRPDGIVACRGYVYTEAPRLYNFVRNLFLTSAKQRQANVDYHRAITDGRIDR